MHDALRLLVLVTIVLAVPDRYHQVVLCAADDVASAGRNDLRFEVHDAGSQPRISALRPEPVVLSQQASNVLSAVYAADGKHVTTVNAHGGVLRWDLLNGTSAMLREAGADHLLCAAISPDGDVLAYATQDNELMLTQLDSDDSPRCLEDSNERTVALAFSNGGRTLVSASAGGTIGVWDTRTGTLTQRLPGRHGPVQSVAVAPDGASLVIAAANEAAQSVALNAEGPVQPVADSPMQTTAIAFSRDHKRLALGSAHGTVRLLRVGDQENSVVLRGHTFAVWSIAFSPRSDVLATASWDGTIRLWDAATGRELGKFKKHDESVNVLVFAPDGESLISAGLDGRLNYWAPDVPAISPYATIGRYQGQVWVATFSPDGNKLLTGGANHALTMWDLTDRKQQLSPKSYEVTRCATFSPNGRLFATGGNDGKIDLWDSASGEKKATLQRHPGAVSAVVFSPDGTTLVSACDGKVIKIWDIASQTEKHQWRGHNEQIYCAAVSPDGRILATGGGNWAADVPGELVVWNMTDGTHVKIPAHRLSIWTVAFSPDGKWLATASSDGIVKIWNIANHSLERSLTYDTWLRPLDFSPDGTRLAVGLGNGQIRLWDTTTWQELAALKGHNSFTFHLEFSPDGEQIASAGEDGTIRLWSLQQLVASPE
jgi:WD40 repeat protein